MALASKVITIYIKSKQKQKKLVYYLSCQAVEISELLLFSDC